MSSSPHDEPCDSGPRDTEAREHKHVGLGDIAAAAGVSKATASRALRDPDSVSTGSRSKVHRALAILGVDSGRSSAHEVEKIALIQPSAPAGNVDPYARLFQLLTDKIFAQRIAVVHVEAVPGQTAALAASLLGPEGGEPHVQGAIVLGGGAAGELAAALAQRSLPQIRVSNARHEDGISRIVLDATDGIATAVQHLVHLGHRRIGLAVLQDSAAAGRIAGFRRSMAQVLHIPATRDQAPVVEAAGGTMAGVAAAEALLHLQCTAVIACAPSLSFGVLEAAARARIDVPRDLSLLTVGDMPDADVIAPPLSQVSYDWEAIAVSALSEVRAMISTPAEAVAIDYAVTPDLVLRASAVPPQRR